MPVLHTNGPDCYLVSYSAEASPLGGMLYREIPESTGQMMSDYLAGLISAEPQGFTDIFILNHGFWKTEAAASADFINWVNGVTARIAADPPTGTFRPLLVATHWPSNPWAGPDSVSLVPAGMSNQQFLAIAQPAMAASSLLSDALNKLADFARNSTLSDLFTDEVIKAVNDAFSEAEQQAGAPAGTLTRLDTGMSLGGFIDWLWRCISEYSALNVVFVALYDICVKPLFDLFLRSSFISYGNQAEAFGGSAVIALVSKLCQAAGDTPRFHMMGHSLGTAVTGAAISEAGGTQPYPTFRSVFLAEGAISTWSFAAAVPWAGNLPGRYAPVTKVTGPVVATSSLCDFMVRYPYPDAARSAGWSGTTESSTSGTSADYQGIGVAGITGPLANSAQLVAMVMQPADNTTPLAGGRTYNVDGTAFISGHSDIFGPAVAQTFWNAVKGTFA